MSKFYRILACTFLAGFLLYGFSINTDNHNSIISASIAEAYPKYWHGNPNYPLLTDETMTGVAVDLSSACVVSQTSRQRVIAVLVYYVPLRYKDLASKGSSVIYFKERDGSVTYSHDQYDWSSLGTMTSQVYNVTRNELANR